jgi:hypothetical protein
MTHEIVHGGLPVGGPDSDRAIWVQAILHLEIG